YYFNSSSFTLSSFFLFLFFFFLIILRPPRSTLFPTRRSSDLSTSRKKYTGILDRTDLFFWVDETSLFITSRGGRGTHSLRALTRSEEHTSELQSRGHLVCRLLLEKKKMKRHI